MVVTPTAWKAAVAVALLIEGKTAASWTISRGPAQPQPEDLFTAGFSGRATRKREGTRRGDPRRAAIRSPDRKPPATVGGGREFPCNVPRNRGRRQLTGHNVIFAGQFDSRAGAIAMRRAWPTSASSPTAAVVRGPDASRSRPRRWVEAGLVGALTVAPAPPGGQPEDAAGREAHYRSFVTEVEAVRARLGALAQQEGTLAPVTELDFQQLCELSVLQQRHRRAGPAGECGYRPGLAGLGAQLPRPQPAAGAEDARLPARAQRPAPDGSGAGPERA